MHKRAISGPNNKLRRFKHLLNSLNRIGLIGGAVSNSKELSTLPQKAAESAEACEYASYLGG